MLGYITVAPVENLRYGRTTILKTSSSADVYSLLRQLRRRWVVRGILHALGASLLVAAGALVIVTGLWQIVRIESPMSLAWPLGLTLAAIGSVVVWVITRFPTLARTAMATDRVGATKDRLLTALTLADREGTLSTLEQLAYDECRGYLATRDFRSLIPVRPPRWAAWVAVPLIAWGLLLWQGANARATLLAEREEAQRAIAGTTTQIEELAKKAEQAAEDAKSEDLRKLAEQLQQSADRLKTERNAEDAEKAAMRELSALEQMMRDLQQQPAPQQEMKELAKAMTSVPGMEDVLNALNHDDLAEAQQAMARAMEKHNDQAPDKMTEEQVEKQLQQAMERMKDQRRLSEALQKFAEQMKKQTGGGMTQQAMKQLQQMMQQQSRQGQGDADSGNQQRQMTLQEMIAALENMKFGEGQANQGSESQQVPNGPQVSMEAFGSMNPQGNPQMGSADMPSGRPGSERDFGTSDTPFGQKSEAQEKGGELALKGQLGQGESLSMMLPSTGDNSTSARRYKDLYEAAASSAQDAVEQENIPLGSRFLVKRYFELIRPR